MNQAQIKAVLDLTSKTIVDSIARGISADEIMETILPTLEAKFGRENARHLYAGALMSVQMRYGASLEDCVETLESVKEG